MLQFFVIGFGGAIKKNAEKKLVSNTKSVYWTLFFRRTRCFGTLFQYFFQNYLLFYRLGIVKNRVIFSKNENWFCMNHVSRHCFCIAFNIFSFSVLFWENGSVHVGTITGRKLGNSFFILTEPTNAYVSCSKFDDNNYYSNIKPERN